MQFTLIFTTLVHIGVGLATLVDFDSSAELGKQFLSQEFEYAHTHSKVITVVFNFDQTQLCGFTGSRVLEPFYLDSPGDRSLSEVVLQVSPSLDVSLRTFPINRSSFSRLEDRVSMSRSFSVDPAYLEYLEA